MPVAPEHLGPWRQIAQRLRFTKDAPPRADRVSERPRHPKTLAFLDEDAPTLITFEPDDAVDVPSLLRAGAIMPLLEILDEGQPEVVVQVEGYPVKLAPKKGGS